MRNLAVLIIALLFCPNAVGQGYTPAWADKTLPLEVRGKQLSVQVSLFSLHIPPGAQLDQLQVKLNPETRNQLTLIFADRVKEHIANLNELKKTSLLEKTTRDEIATIALQKYEDAEWIAEEKLARSIEEELTPIETDRLLKAVGRRSSFLGHPLAMNRLKLNETQVSKLRSMQLVQAAMVLETVAKTDLPNPSNKSKIDLGVPYAIEKAKVFAQLTDQQLKDYLDLMEAFENGATSRDFFLSMDHGHVIVDYLKSKLDAIDRN